MVSVKSLQNLNIKDYISETYDRAKPAQCNLELVYATGSKTPVNQSKPCGQLKCESLKFPFARNGALPTSVPIKKADVLVVADVTTQTKRVVELTLDLSVLDYDFDYAPGDTIAILPSNADEVVQKLLQRLDLHEQAETICSFKLVQNAKKTAKVPAHIPPETTPRELFTHCLQLNGVLQKQFLSALAFCTFDPDQREFLYSLSSKQGSAYYNELILEKGLCLIDILEICHTCEPPLELLVEYLPRLLPRPYSIANSPMESENDIRIIYSVLSERVGVTTHMLEKKIQQDQAAAAKLIIYPRLINAFRYTADDMSSNQILIAVGTGLAPFLGFLAHKQRCCHQGSPSRSIGQTWLYLGAKTPEAVLKLNDLQEWQNSDIVQRLRLCFSRVSELSEEAPKYVQELLKKDAAELIELLQHPATVLYVCADGAKISKAIQDGIKQCLISTLNLDEEAAMKQVQDMRKAGKYREDTWL
ncbi:methionine synthase reductase [Scaptodrosophila lebanonensis]|uniref:Methionine synthase reductase n=1 Tax=Drosophila lebanonensis TaxID=7225 RepID=A0A6J2TLY4_DROLE|nr:methionine synthase reductase [Scaptodrosophila lebanonensis]